jgi:gliding motility-associated-like protein
VAGLEALGITIADNCTSDANLVVTFTETAAGSCPLVITRTYTITDACNNQSTVTETINIGDNIAPVVTGTIAAQNITGCVATDAPAAQTTVAGIETLGITIADNCTSDANLVVTFTETAAGSCPLVITRTYTITDACNNQSTVTETINIGDNVNPTFLNFPPDVTVNCDAVPPLASVIVTGSDNCTLNPTVTFISETGSPSTCGYTLIRTWNLTDDCGNTITNSQTITVLPASTPVVTIPAGLPTTLTYNNATQFSWNQNATYSNSESGSCLLSGTLTPTLTPNFTICGGGTITIDYQGVDACNNPVTAQHVIAVSPVLPTVNITTPLSTIFNSQSTQLTAVGSPIGGTYSWSPSATISPTNSDIVNATPTTTTTYTVTYDLGGCIATDNITITVNDLTIAVNSSTICSGSSTTLTATPSDPGGTYLWSPGGQTTQSITVSPTTNDIYTCIYTLNGVATTPTTGFVTVNQTPTVTVNSPTICSGSNATLTASGNPSGGSYLWSDGTITSSITVTPNATTSYTVTYTLNSCVGTATSNITVNPMPTVSLSPATICAGQSSTVTATPNPSGGTFTWNNAQTTSSITISPIVTTNYTVLYVLNGCTTTGTGVVTVNPIPSVTVSSATICAGETATITAIPNATGGTYTWANNSATSNSLTVNPSSTTNYSVTYSLNGCNSSGSSGTVTVNPLPVVNVNSPTICEGQSATISATASIPSGTYLWSPNGETTSSITVNPSITTSYSLVYDVNGCISAPVTSTVTVNPIPTVGFVADQLTGCAPLTVTFSNTVGNQSNCSWDFGNGQLTNDCVASYTFYQGGCYDISLTTTENGCSNTLTLNDYICVENLPIAAFTTSISTFTDPTQTVSFSNNSVGASSYSWDFGNQQTSTDENPVHTYSNTSNGYTITLTATSAMGCTDTYQQSIQYQEGEVFYIPNTFTPDGDNHNQTFKPIFTTGFDPYNFEMIIYNRWGESIFETHNADEGWDGSYGKFGIKVNDGTYTYKIIYKNPQIDERKIVVGHVTLIR